jgi:biotin transport system substrate-specific component
MINQRRFITNLVFVSLFAALISAGSFIAIPLGPVPIALQNFFALLSGLVLGPFLGAAAVGLFILAGTVGLPVFANNTMGIARLMGPSGGYIFGYLLGTFAAGLIIGFPKQGEKIKYWRLGLAAAAGMCAVYIPGLFRLKFTLNLNWPQTLVSGLYPFIIGDVIKIIIAVLITPRLRRAAARQLTGNK